MRASASAYILSGGSALRMLEVSDDAQPAAAASAIRALKAPSRARQDRLMPSMLGNPNFKEGKPRVAPHSERLITRLATAKICAAPGVNIPPHRRFITLDYV